MPAISEFITPRFFVGQDHFPFLRVDDFSAVQYRSGSNQYRNRIITTAHLFVVVLSGEKILHTPEGDLHIPAGGAFFARKGAYLFSEMLTTQDAYRTLVFFIDDSFLQRFLGTHHHLLDRRPACREQNIFPIPVTPLLAAGANATLPFFEHDTVLSRQLLRIKLEELLLHIIAADTGGQFIRFLHTQHSTRKRDLRALMEEYFLKRVSLAELAKLSGRSLSAFKRDFKTVFNDSPRHWITNRRLEHARMLLAGTDLNVSEACLQAGFDNFSNFSQIFKKKFGFSPGSLQLSRN
jgi:AraC-like DNA-binding protein